MGTLASIKAQLQREKMLAEQKTDTVDELIRSKYVLLLML
jgi:hypothetical protein